MLRRPLPRHRNPSFYLDEEQSFVDAVPAGFPLIRHDSYGHEPKVRGQRHRTVQYLLGLLGLAVLASCATSSQPRSRSVTLSEGVRHAGTYPVGGGSVGYEYSLRLGRVGSPDNLEMRFDLLSAPAATDAQLNLVIRDGSGRPVYTHLLFEIERGQVLTGTRRELRIEAHEPRSFELTPGERRIRQ